MVAMHAGTDSWDGRLGHVVYDVGDLEAGIIPGATRKHISFALDENDKAGDTGPLAPRGHTLSVVRLRGVLMG